MGRVDGCHQHHGRRARDIDSVRSFISFIPFGSFVRDLLRFIALGRGVAGPENFTIGKTVGSGL